MLILYYLFLKNPLMLCVAYLTQVVPYFFVLKKMGLNQFFALIPNLAEFFFTKKLFPKKRTFFRPFFVAAVLIGFSYYLGILNSVAILYLMIAFVIYGIFLIRLYRRMAKAFGKKWYFVLGLILLPPVFLLILGLSKSEFKQPSFPPAKPTSRGMKIFKRIAFVGISIVEVVAIVLVSGLITFKERKPRFVIEGILDQVQEISLQITDEVDVVTREDVLGEETQLYIDANKGRDYYFPDHSNDKEAIVFVYLVGADLEDKSGCASANITQMIEASKQGTGLKFVLEIGGANRWFTKGIASKSYGRYEIYDGQLTKIEDLPSTTNMSSEKTLTEFLTWTKDNYSSDRTMLVFWDHGGGVQYGYGMDDINGNQEELILSPTIMASAFKNANVKFDWIGFDACLMQDIEIGKIFEPYADFLLASEEIEGGFGWSYIHPFGELAKNPGMSTEEFATTLISCYDTFNRFLNDGELDSASTLSLTDLTLINSAYSKLDSFFEETSKKMLDNSQVFADVSIAGKNTYDFSQYQIDLIGFLQILDELDYNEVISTHEEKKELINSIASTIVCQNGASAQGINGISFGFQYNNMPGYENTEAQLKNLGLDNEKNFFDQTFSIMAAQQMKMYDVVTTADGFDLMTVLGFTTGNIDYTKKDWYISGFEDYDDTPSFVDIPLIEGENGYSIDLPETTWNSITDVQTMVYQKVDEDGAYSRYIGNDYLGLEDENGHATVHADNYWVHLNGELVCYEAQQIRTTDDGTDIFTGTIRARLNNKENITIIVEWEETSEDEPTSGRVLGYEVDKEDNEMVDKGYTQFVAGDKIQFLFDYYDAQGNFVETKTAGKAIRVSKQERLKVTDEKMDPCTIEFGGVLQDIYQRTMTTEMMEMTIE